MVPSKKFQTFQLLAGQQRQDPAKPKLMLQTRTERQSPTAKEKRSAKGRLSSRTQVQLDQPPPLAAVPTERDTVYTKRTKGEKPGCFGLGRGRAGLIQVLIALARSITNQYEHSEKIKLNKDFNH